MTSASREVADLKAAERAELTCGLAGVPLLRPAWREIIEERI
jgi:hypothetical protein